MSASKRTTSSKSVEALTHEEAKRKNIPSAEQQSILPREIEKPAEIRFPRNTAEKLAGEKAARDLDLDPQLVWRGKDQQDWSDLVVKAPPLYIQEKIHPKALIDDLLRETNERQYEEGSLIPDLFADFNGLPKGADKTEFYRYDGNWQNRMILGDSLNVMASLAEREGLRGKVQCIYFDPPYGIKFNSNFQWSTTSRDVRDGNAAHITREPEQVKAFRDTWRDGIHSYLTYLRDRLTVARDLLTESGSIFVQIGDENVHRVRALMDEVFGEENFISQISFVTTSSQTSTFLSSVQNFLIWYGKNNNLTKYRDLFEEKEPGGPGATKYTRFESDKLVRTTLNQAYKHDLEIQNGKIFRIDTLTSQSGGHNAQFKVEFNGNNIYPRRGFWKTNIQGFKRLIQSNRIEREGRSIGYIRYITDFKAFPTSNLWDDYFSVQSRIDPKVYVVQTATRVIQRCILMTTDPGDLVLDPTCGSGTTAYTAEQWGRRWITIDTSRVALALARARLMGARYPYYLLADSAEGKQKEAEITRSIPNDSPTAGNLAHGFVYERVPHITLRDIANNSEIDLIWEEFESKLEPVRQKLTELLPPDWLPNYRKKQKYTAEVPASIQEWEIPREKPDDWDPKTEPLIARFWKLRIERQTEIDASIAAKADFKYLYDKPYEDRRKVRVAGPFTVESLSPHRMIGPDENGEMLDPAQVEEADVAAKQTFPQMILETLRTSGVQQARKENRITFTSLTGWPGEMICGEGRYKEGETQKRAGIFIGPEFGTVQRADLVAAAREAAEAGFDILIACAFSYEAHTTEFDKLGRLPVLKAQMNADLHMADDLKNTGQGNLFVIFGEPEIELIPEKDGRFRVEVKGIDIFNPSTGAVVSNNVDEIACWLLDTDYNEESFFVRHAYFLGQNDPYQALKRTLKSEIDPEAWETLNSAVSRPFPAPKSGRIAIKVINHLGDEVMKVMRV